MRKVLKTYLCVFTASVNTEINIDCATLRDDLNGVTHTRAHLTVGTFFVMNSVGADSDWTLENTHADRHRQTDRQTDR